MKSAFSALSQQKPRCIKDAKKAYVEKKETVAVSTAVRPMDLKTVSSLQNKNRLATTKHRHELTIDLPLALKATSIFLAVILNFSVM